MASYQNAVYSDHALLEMQRRAIDKSIILAVLQQPDSVHDVRPSRIVLHKTFLAENTQKMLLYRVFIDIDREPYVIVTAYKTSKIAKYESIQ